MIQILITIKYLYHYINFFQRGKNWASSLDVLDTDLDSHSDFCPTVSAGKGVRVWLCLTLIQQIHVTTPTHPHTPNEIKKSKQTKHTPQTF